MNEDNQLLNFLFDPSTVLLDEHMNAIEATGNDPVPEVNALM